ncbi:MAG: PHP domain-containing protein [Gammaproteobacteria bacterium]|nr:PHP domain-containing protein [Gammaproteobacteria bacterium]
MGVCYDLHSHSRCSDGALSPAELVRHARACGVDVLALTDHDTTAGIAEARAAARDSGLCLIAGVEISVTWAQRVIHIVGLDIDPRCAGLQAGLAGLRWVRRERARHIADRLARCGIPGALEAAEVYAGAEVIGRNHFARFLVERGYVRDAKRAFKRYLGRGGSCHVASEWAGLAEAVAWIRAAGGIAVVAHPTRYAMSRGVMRRFLEEFTAAGGGGIEVVSGRHDVQQARMLAAYAREFGLCASVGSDFHAPENSWTVPGRLAALPPGCEPVWARWPAAGHADAIPVTV